MVQLKAIIPAKLSSSRVPGKNWRDFHNGDSLVDINILALTKAGLSPVDIYVSSESEEKLSQVRTRHGVQTLRRSEFLCRNETSLSEFIQGIVADVPGDDDVIWSQVCDPLFSEHSLVIDLWKSVNKNHDSLCVAHPFKQYLMDSGFHPIGWGFGKCHVPSQRLPTLYQFPFTLSILTRECIRDVGYHVGKTPYWYVSKGGGIDIDTEDEFRTASVLYTERQKWINTMQ